MARYLLVAHQTAQSPELLEAVKGLAQEDPAAEFVIVVPATPVEHMLVWEEGETADLARRRAEAARSRLEAHGLIVVDAVTGDPDPVAAIGDELRRGGRVGAIVISTLPAGVSRWLGLDVLSRVKRNFSRHRVIHVEAAAPVSPHP